MVARLFRLRVALAGGAFRGSLTQGLRTALLLVLGAAGAVALAWAPTLLSPVGPMREATDVLIGSLLLVLTFGVPFFTNRRNLTPRQFATYPATSGQLAWSLLVSTIATWPFLIFAVWIAALVATRAEWRDPAWIAPCALVLVAIFAISLVRLASGLSRLLAGDRYAGGLRAVGAVLAVALLPIAVFGVAEFLRLEDPSIVVDSANPLAWTPFGAGFAAISDVAAGHTDLGTLRLAVLGASIVLVVLAWFAVVRASLSRVERPIDLSSARSGLGWFERFAARPAPAIAARLITYWSRDPRYRVALIALPIAPIAIMVAFLVAGAELHFAVAIPLPVLMLLLGWSQHNDIAMDSTAIWEHVSSGIPGWADRAGRLAPVLMIGVPLAVVGSSVTATFMADWRVLPALLGMNLGVLLAAVASTSVFSALMPYPATRPGDSPFVQPQWSGSGSGTSQTLSILVAVVLSVPAVWSAVLAIADPTFLGNMWALVLGVGFGVAVLFAGIAIGGRIFDRQGPEILAVTQIFD